MCQLWLRIEPFYHFPLICKRKDAQSALTCSMRAYGDLHSLRRRNTKKSEAALQNTGNGFGKSNFIWRMSVFDINNRVLRVISIEGSGKLSEVSGDCAWRIFKTGPNNRLGETGERLLHKT